MSTIEGYANILNYQMDRLLVPRFTLFCRYKTDGHTRFPHPHSAFIISHLSLQAGRLHYGKNYHYPLSYSHSIVPGGLPVMS